MTTPKIANIPRSGNHRTGLGPLPKLVELVELGPTSRRCGQVIAMSSARVARHGGSAGMTPPAHRVIARAQIVDRLGARLDFERAGMQMYQALIGKLDASGAFRGGPSRRDLEDLRDEEHRHLMLARGLIVELGADPDVVTPRASLQAAASAGLCELVADPRTTLVEALDAIVIAELVDHESWDQLAAEIARLGDEQAESQIREAERAEAAHLARVRVWLAAAVEHAAKPRD